MTPPPSTYLWTRQSVSRVRQDQSAPLLLPLLVLWELIGQLSRDVISYIVVSRDVISFIAVSRDIISFIAVSHDMTSSKYVT